MRGSNRTSAGAGTLKLRGLFTGCVATLGSSGGLGNGSRRLADDDGGVASGRAGEAPQRRARGLPTAHRLEARQLKRQLKATERKANEMEERFEARFAALERLALAAAAAPQPQPQSAPQWAGGRRA
mmetsp:Transcript_161435/g.518401  ORF Transcript_161435/g.518401 Transcript_161435/m.518401 type:complete len:127 (+) Transcript_161435:1831-2211(+)